MAARQIGRRAKQKVTFAGFGTARCATGGAICAGVAAFSATAAARCVRAAGIRANRCPRMIRGFLSVPHMFFSFSYTLADALAGDSTSRERRTLMTQMALLAESELRRDLSRLLLAAVEASGRARCDIARETGIHKDALRRILAGSRSASLAETLRILAAAGAAPNAHLLLFLAAGGNQATGWLQSDLARFFEDLVCELPGELE